jgi:O-antigen ligase
VYPVLAATALPWSTTAVAIFIVLWFVVLLPTLNFRKFCGQLKRPAFFLPLALFAVAALGMLWTVDTWAVRLQALAPVAKLAAIPFLLYQFERSQRGHWVFIAFLASCSLLMVLSWIVYFAPDWKIAGPVAPGVPVRNYIDQTHEFVLCTFGLAALLVTFIIKRKVALALGCTTLLLGFLSNMSMVVVSKSAFLYVPFLAVIFAETFLSRKLALSFYAAGALALTCVWFSSPFLQYRAEHIRFEPNLNNGPKNMILGNSLGQRLQYWRASWEAIKTAPLFGKGTGSTTKILQVRDEMKTDVSDEKVRNPHNQILYVAVQWGLFGALVLLFMWGSHLLLFWRTADIMGWLGLVIVTQNTISSTVNSHLFDFLEGWLYVLGVGVAGGTTHQLRWLRSGALPDSESRVDSKHPRGSPMIRVTAEIAAIIFLWPLYSLRNCIRFSGNERRWSTKIGTFGSFLPVLMISTVIWAAGWATGLWLAGLP